MRVACEAEGTLGTCSPGLALEPHSGSCLPPAFVTCQLCQAQFPAQPGICTQSPHDPRCFRHHVDAMVPQFSSITIHRAGHFLQDPKHLSVCTLLKWK